MLARWIFLILLVLSLTPWWSPPLALVTGALFGLALGNPFARQTRAATTPLLQAAVVGLGFGMNLFEVIHAGRCGFVYTFCGIVFALALGMGLARIFGVRAKAGYLISVGTAICGGSAIAAVGPVVDASDEEMSVSIATVFLLNSVALLIFPVLGHTFQLTESQFGVWAALAIHDTSSVVGAAAKYGPHALAIATTVKLARALWIVPVTLASAALYGRRARQRAEAVGGQAAEVNVGESGMGIRWPWFIGVFLLAAVANTYLPGGHRVYAFFYEAAKTMLTVTLFLIGTGITRASLRRVGVRPLLQAVVLWLIVGAGSLTLIRMGVVGIG